MWFRPRKRPDPAECWEFTMEVNTAMKNAVQDLSRDLEIPEGEVIGRSIALLHYALQQRALGNHLVLADADAKILARISLGEETLVCFQKKPGGIS